MEMNGEFRAPGDETGPGAHCIRDCVGPRASLDVISLSLWLYSPLDLDRFFIFSCPIHSR
jgi:hypothetical protein